MTNSMIKSVMALPCVQHSVALRVKFYLYFVLIALLLSFHVRYVRAHIKYDRVTLLQLGELNYRGYFDTNVLDSFPELHLHAGATPGQAITGGFPGTGRPIQKRGRRGTKTPPTG